MLTHVDLFSGIGGFSLACQWAGVETIAFAEIDPYANRVLERRFPGIRNYGDVRNVPSLSAWLLTAGVPCQPASVAGKRRGAADDRWLWPQTLAVVENGNYEWLVFENPTGILSLNDGLEFERICLALEGQGYEVQPLAIPACGVGALHRRNRIWILAKAICGRRGAQGERGGLAGIRGDRAHNSVSASESSSNVGHALRLGVEYAKGRSMDGDVFREIEREEITDSIKRSGGWAPEPNVGRVANGIPKRVDRLRCLGNAIVPQVAYQLIKRMMEAEAHNEMSLETTT